MDYEAETIKQFVKDIIPAIESIDGGCESCITEFIDSVNDELVKHELKLEFNGDNVTVV